MKGVFWNSDGFKDPKKHKFILDLTKEHNLSFIAISETRRKNFTSLFLKICVLDEIFYGMLRSLEDAQAGFS